MDTLDTCTRVSRLPGSMHGPPGWTRFSSPPSTMARCHVTAMLGWSLSLSGTALTILRWDGWDGWQPNNEDEDGNVNVKKKKKKKEKSCPSSCCLGREGGRHMLRQERRLTSPKSTIRQAVIMPLNYLPPLSICCPQPSMQARRAGLGITSISHGG